MPTGVRKGRDQIADMLLTIEKARELKKYNVLPLHAAGAYLAIGILHCTKS